jgi:hypothetical protein
VGLTLVVTGVKTEDQRPRLVRHVQTGSGTKEACDDAGRDTARHMSLSDTRCVHLRPLALVRKGVFLRAQ